MLSFEQNDISDTISIFKNKYFHIVIMKTTFLSVKFTMFKKNQRCATLLFVCILAKVEHHASSFINNDLGNKFPPLRLFHIINLFSFTV